MSVMQKLNLVALVIGLLSMGWYASRILPQLDLAPDTIAWKAPMAISIGVLVVLIVIAAVVIASNDRDLRESPNQLDDERDREYELRGDAWTGHVMQGFVFLAIALAMFEFSTFWVANTLYAGVMISGAVGLVIRLAGYRGGV